MAVTGDTPMDVREDALHELQAGKLRAVFTVDLFNEGVDIPGVDTLLLLRPTDSATLFLQQLGCGVILARRCARCWTSSVATARSSSSSAGWVRCSVEVEPN